MCGGRYVVFNVFVRQTNFINTIKVVIKYSTAEDYLQVPIDYFKYSHKKINLEL